MARTQGPLFSLEAKGELGNALVYANWKGRSYTREKVKPVNKNSLAQRAARGWYGHISQNWASLNDSERHAWSEIADAANISLFNAYLGKGVDSVYNADVFKDFPDQNTGITNISIDFISASGGNGQIDLEIVLFNPMSDKETVGFAIQRQTIDDAKPKDIQFFWMDPEQNQSIITSLTDIPAGNYNAMLYGFKPGGTMFEEHWSDQVTVS